MKKVCILILLCLGLCGCATAPMYYNPDIGITKEQVYQDRSDPVSWSRRVIDGHIYETWIYDNAFVGTYDFVDNILVGYSKRAFFGNMEYYSKDKTEDIKDYAR